MRQAISLSSGCLIVRRVRRRVSESLGPAHASRCLGGVCHPRLYPPLVGTPSYLYIKLNHCLLLSLVPRRPAERVHLASLTVLARVYTIK